MASASFVTKVPCATMEGGCAEANPDRLSWTEGSPDRHLPRDPQSRRHRQARPANRRAARGAADVIDLPYSLIIEATGGPDFFGFYSDELEGFSGVGHSVEDCLYRAKWGMKEHL